MTRLFGRVARSGLTKVLILHPHTHTHALSHTHYVTQTCALLCFASSVAFSPFAHLLTVSWVVYWSARVCSPAYCYSLLPSQAGSLGWCVQKREE